MPDDKRALFAAAIACLAIVSATILGALGKNELAIAEAGMASSALLFIIGLHSEPKDSGGDDATDQVE